MNRTPIGISSEKPFVMSMVSWVCLPIGKLVTAHEKLTAGNAAQQHITVPGLEIAFFKTHRL